jgi:hypothetical protein
MRMLKVSFNNSKLEAVTWRTGRNYYAVHIVTCYATEDAVLIGNSFYLQLHVVATITFYTVTYLHSLHANLFSLSEVIFAYSVSLSLKHFFTYELPVTLSCRELLCSLSHVTTDGQSVSLSWYKAPIRGLRPDFFSVRNTEYV